MPATLAACEGIFVHPIYVDGEEIAAGKPHVVVQSSLVSFDAIKVPTDVYTHSFGKHDSYMSFYSILIFIV